MQTLKRTLLIYDRKKQQQQCDDTLQDLGKIVMSQKAKLFGRHGSSYIWCKVNTAFNNKSNIPAVKHGSSAVMVCCFAASEPGNLFIDNGTMDLLSTTKSQGRMSN